MHEGLSNLVPLRWLVLAKYKRTTEAKRQQMVCRQGEGMSSADDDIFEVHLHRQPLWACDNESRIIDASLRIIHKNLISNAFADSTADYSDKTGSDGTIRISAFVSSRALTSRAVNNIVHMVLVLRLLNIALKATLSDPNFSKPQA